MRDPSSLPLWGARLLTVLLLCLTLGALWASAGGCISSAEAGTTSGATAESGRGGDPSPGDAGTSSEAHQRHSVLSPAAAGLIASLYILILAGFVGFEVIGGVSPLLHTPLMSATNAISAISIVGALVIAGSVDYPDYLSRILGFFAVMAASINVVGGFMITDRMLRMFRAKEARR